MQMKIRKAMQDEERGLLDGIVEADETFVGGKVNSQFPRKKNQPEKPRGQEHLKPVFAMIQREGKAIAYVINKASREEIIPILKAQVSTSSELVTDASYIYFPIKEYFKSHKVMSRGAKIFKRGIYHKNTIEGYFSQFKRAIIGQYHKIGEKYMQLYLDEISFKYNQRYCSDNGFNCLLERLLNPSTAN